MVPIFFGAFKHHVLEIMGNAGIRAILCPGLNDDSPKDFWAANDLHSAKQ